MSDFVDVERDLFLRKGDLVGEFDGIGKILHPLLCILSARRELVQRGIEGIVIHLNEDLVDVVVVLGDVHAHGRHAVLAAAHGFGIAGQKAHFVLFLVQIAQEDGLRILIVIHFKVEEDVILGLLVLGIGLETDLVSAHFGRLRIDIEREREGIFLPLHGILSSERRIERPVHGKHIAAVIGEVEFGRIEFEFDHRGIDAPPRRIRLGDVCTVLVIDDLPRHGILDLKFHMLCRTEHACIDAVELVDRVIVLGIVHGDRTLVRIGIHLVVPFGQLVDVFAERDKVLVVIICSERLRQEDALRRLFVVGMESSCMI